MVAFAKKRTYVSLFNSVTYRKHIGFSKSMVGV